MIAIIIVIKNKNDLTNCNRCDIIGAWDIP